MARRILIVDDIPSNRIVLKVKLASACYETVQAGDGATALELARSLAPDLILLDVMLPDMAGTEVCRRLKADPETADIPVVMVTALREDEARREALRAGADDFLSKPLYESILLARIRSLLRARDTARELRLREGTSRALGLAEAATPFAAAPPMSDARIGLIAPRTEIATAWQAALAPHLGANMTVLAHDAVLADDSTGFDLYVLAADLVRSGDGLRLMSELRSRPGSRHAAFCIVLGADAGETGAMALDLGASDLLLPEFDPQETAMRLTAQIRRKRQGDRLRAGVRDGLELAVTDPLTGLYNRRYAIPHLARTLSEAAQSGRTCAVVLLDLDDFKSVNDHFGHPAGDTVLAEAARRMRAALRPSDLLSRIGGDEFLALIPDTDAKVARHLVRRLVKAVQEAPIALPDGTGWVRITVSAGMAMSGDIGPAVPGADPAQAERMIEAADRALMAAKASSRDRLTGSMPPEPDALKAS